MENMEVGLWDEKIEKIVKLLFSQACQIALIIKCQFWCEIWKLVDHVFNIKYCSFFYTLIVPKFLQSKINKN